MYFNHKILLGLDPSTEIETTLRHKRKPNHENNIYHHFNLDYVFEDVWNVSRDLVYSKVSSTEIGQTRSIN